MRPRNRQHVYISVPADCELPVESGMPKFYKTLDFSKTHIIQRDFKLKSKPKDNDFTLVAIADVQIGGVKDVAEFDNPVMPGILSYTQTLKGHVLGISYAVFCLKKKTLSLAMIYA